MSDKSSCYNSKAKLLFASNVSVSNCIYCMTEQYFKKSYVVYNHLCTFQNVKDSLSKMNNSSTII